MSAMLRKWALIAAIPASLFAGLLAGNWISDNNLKDRILAMLRPAPAPAPASIATQNLAWKPVRSNLHDLEMLQIQLAPFTTAGRGGAIESIDGHIVFVSPVGQLGYLSPDMRIERIAMDVDLNLPELKASPIYEQPGFLSMMFRVLDLLAVRREDGTHDLYVSHHRFAKSGCFEVVISRTQMAVSGASVAPVSGKWEDFYVAKPCLPPKQRGFVFEGNETGGRMVMREGKLLLSLGDADFNGVNDEAMFAQDPRVDFGKVIEIDLATRESGIFTSGHRNPQGLLVAGDGRVWSTEHGPKGGDEINILRRGENHGWPIVTFGMQYDYGTGPRRSWPYNPIQGRHDGYDPPEHTFVPSIGVSNLIEPSEAEFPLWKDHLLMGSLYIGRSLHLIRRTVDGEGVRYIEPIMIDKVVRDLILLDDGRLAVLTDTGELSIIRNAERAAADDVEDTAVTVRVSDSATREAKTTGQDVASDPSQVLFVDYCIGCHSLTGVNGVGPSLKGVFGKRVGSVQGYAYSAGMTGRDEVWTYDRMVDFLANPAAVYPGTTMPPLQIGPDEIVDVVKYLRNRPDS